MQDWLERHRFAVTATTLLVIPLILMYFHGRRGQGASFLEKVSVATAGVAQSGVRSVVDSVAGVFEGYIVLVHLSADNERLKLENERLVAEALLSKRLAVENLELRDLLGMSREQTGLRIESATVIAKEVTPFFRVIRMRVEGATKPTSDMAVIHSKGLVGRIVDAAGRFGDVMLLSDRRSRVACQIMGSGTLGMLIGTGSHEEYSAKLQVSLTEPVLKAGSTVMTSGHDRVFPRGVEVGYVLEPENRRHVGAFLEYDVALSVNPAAIDQVMIVIGNRDSASAGEGEGQ